MTFDKKAETALAAFAADFNAITFEAANAIAVEAQILITRGAVSGKNHVPSLPGQPPMNDSGALANGIETLNPEPLRSEVRATAPHSVPLETGTSRMAARPYLQPARDKMRDQVKRNAVKKLNAALRRHFGAK